MAGWLSGTFCSRLYGSFWVVVFNAIVLTPCAFKPEKDKKKMRKNIFLNKFTYQSYEKETKEEVVFEVH
jgi:hypothetical protein